jgi:hypothetical protein
VSIRDRVWRSLTGTPWTTTRSMAAEYGPTPAMLYPELGAYSDADLLRLPQLRSPGWAHLDARLGVRR